MAYRKFTILEEDKHREAIKKLLISDSSLTVAEIRRKLETDKKNPLILNRDYIIKVVKELKQATIDSIEDYSISELLGEVMSQYNAIKDVSWSIINGPDIRQNIITVPDANDPGNAKKATKKVITTRITTGDRINAMKVLQAGLKDYVDKMIIAGKLKGSDDIDKNLFGEKPSIRLTQVNVQNNDNSSRIISVKDTPIEQLNDAEYEIRARIQSALSDIDKLRGATRKSGSSEGEIVSSSQSAISDDASFDGGIHQSEEIPRSET